MIGRQRIYQKLAQQSVVTNPALCCGAKVLVYTVPLGMVSDTVPAITPYSSEAYGLLKDT